MPDTIQSGGIAHGDWIWRKQLAAGAVLGRRSVYVACKAEVDWATRHGGVGQEWGLGVIAGSPSHVRAANAVVNAWGHLQPVEHRIRAGWARLHAQRRAGWDTTETAADLRWYLAERRKLAKRFDELSAVYHEKRAEFDQGVAA